MKLLSSEDRGDGDEDGKLDIVKGSIDSKCKFEKSPAVSKVKTAETKMGKTHTASDNSCVDHITSGVESCRIVENGPTLHEVTGDLERLSISHNNEESKETEKQSGEQDKAEDGDESSERKDGQEASEEETTACHLVRLVAPPLDPGEENSDSEAEEGPQAETEIGPLIHRGPMHGVPSNYEVESGHAYISSKSYTPYQQPAHLNGSYGGPMPANFPNYQNFQSQPMYGEQGRQTKRGRDEREMPPEPPKYVRPQNAGSMGAMATMNNLNAPGKKVSSVCQRQMSGGTVYAPDNMPISAEQIMTGMAGSNSNYAEGQQQLDCQPSSRMFDRQDSMGLTDFSVPYSCLNIPVNMDAVNVDDFLLDDGPHVDGGYHAGQLQQPEGPLPPVSSLANLGSADYHQQAYGQYNYPYQLPHQASTDSGSNGSGGKRASINSQEDVGYNSDLSPTHDTQFPPSPPTMEASPGPSPQGTHRWSPPPSNMSEDSGICSPIPEDQSGYTSQVKSPRQVYGKPMGNNSPCHTGVLGSSPPQQQMMSPATMAMSPLHVAMSPMQMPSPLPDSLGSEHQQHPYIDLHLEDLHNALEVASDDLKNETLKRGIPAQTRAQGSLQGMATAISGFGQMALNGNSQSVLPSHLNGISMAPVPINTTKAGLAVSEVPPNLPTTVPISIAPVHKVDVTSIPSTGKGAKNEMPRTMPIATVILTEGRNTFTQPSANSQGKLLLPPLPKTGKQCQLFPTSVLIVAPSHPPQAPAQRRLVPIAPKDPTKHGDKSGEAKGKSPTTDSGRPGAAVEPGKGGNEGAAPPAGKKPTAAPATLLNLARRLVAELSDTDLQDKDQDGDTILHVAVCRADHFMVQALLERLKRKKLNDVTDAQKLNDMIDAQNTMGQTPLYLAVSTGHPKMVQLLVSEGADVNPFAERALPSGAYEKSAAIHCACSKGSRSPRYVETLKALLKAPDINLNQVNSEGHTALHCAILAHKKPEADNSYINSIPIIQALIPAGADPNLQVQQSGKTALMYALESRDLDLIESVFQLVDPAKLPAFLKTQAFDGVSCWKIAESLKTSLDAASQQRLSSCLKPRPSR